MNKLLQAIERIGAQSGMKLNLQKCEVIQYGGRGKVRLNHDAYIKEVQSQRKNPRGHGNTKENACILAT